MEDVPNENRNQLRRPKYQPLGTTNSMVRCEAVVFVSCETAVSIACNIFKSSIRKHGFSRNHVNFIQKAYCVECLAQVVNANDVPENYLLLKKCDLEKESATLSYENKRLQ